MKAVYALYETGDAAQRAVNGLRSAGYDDRDITVISAAPMEEYEFSHIGHESYQWYIACAGGLAGMLASTWLVTFAEQAWPITVGNMPIVAWWPNLIVIFEMTMLGAIVTSDETGDLNSFMYSRTSLPKRLRISEIDLPAVDVA